MISNFLVTDLQPAVVIPTTTPDESSFEKQSQSFLRNHVALDKKQFKKQQINGLKASTMGGTGRNNRGVALTNPYIKEMISW